MVDVHVNNPVPSHRICRGDFTYLTFDGEIVTERRWFNGFSFEIGSGDPLYFAHFNTGLSTYHHDKFLAELEAEGSILISFKRVFFNQSGEQVNAALPAKPTLDPFELEGL